MEFFLKHHRPPEFKIRLRDALKLFLDEKERDGLRPRTQQDLKASIERFIKAVDNPWTHEVRFYNLEAISARQNPAKSAKITQREISLVRRWNREGLLSGEGLAEVEAAAR